MGLSLDVVTIDGFAGVGKSTVARNAAKQLGFLHINSGLIYRAVAYKVQKKGGDTTDGLEVLSALAESRLSYIQVSAITGENVLGIALDDVALGDELLQEKVGKGASEVAKFLEVRDLACRLQRSVAKEHSVVAEGRDAGTIVFPDARFKFFLTTSTRIAAQRRLGQLRPDIRQAIERSPEQFIKELDRIEQEILQRNLRDASNELAPTVKADDAEEIDTSELSADEVVERIVQRVNSQLKTKS